MKEIEALNELFYRAYCGTSFSPEVRASQCIKDFSAELSADLSELGDRTGDYKEKYLSHLTTWLSRKSRCMSTMIAGPANFPVERNRKAFNSEQRAWEEFREWRDRYIKRVNRVPVKSPEEEIDDALIKLEKERNAQSLMIEVNKVLRKKADEAEKRKILSEELELSAGLIDKIMTPDPWQGSGFARFELTNSNSRIKALEEKLATMRARIARRDTFEPIQFPGGVIGIEDDRVVIRHDEKPGATTIDALKSRGFHWSPRGQFWCRKHTANAIVAAKVICGVK